jgi:hypothetical protein
MEFRKRVTRRSGLRLLVPFVDPERKMFVPLIADALLLLLDALLAGVEELPRRRMEKSEGEPVRVDPVTPSLSTPCRSRDMCTQCLQGIVKDMLTCLN